MARPVCIWTPAAPRHSGRALAYMKIHDTEARVIKHDGQIGFAAFCSEEIAGQKWLVLDMGLAPDIQPRLFHPPQSLLTNEPGSEPYPHHYVGEPIDLRKYENIPVERRGWRLSD